MKKLIQTALTAAALLLAATQTKAQSIQYGTGTFNWDNGTTAAWSSTSGGPYTSVWTSGNDAVFEGTAGTVSVLSGGATANGLKFNTSGYTIQNNTLTLNGTAPSINFGAAGYTATISSIIAGSVGLMLTTNQTGTAGTLTLTGANTYTGTTTINAGTLALSGGNNRLATAGTVSFNGTNSTTATLDLGTTSQTLAAFTIPGTYLNNLSNMTTRLGVVIPAYKEQENIAALLAAVVKAAPGCAVVVVDDSPDSATADAARQTGLAEVVARGRKGGRGSAARRGLGRLLALGCSRCVEMDADFSHPPAQIPELVRELKGRSLDLLIASRYLRTAGSRNAPAAAPFPSSPIASRGCSWGRPGARLHERLSLLLAAGRREGRRALREGRGRLHRLERDPFEDAASRIFYRRSCPRSSSTACAGRARCRRRKSSTPRWACSSF